VNKRHLNGKVTFLGNQTRIEAILPVSDLFLLPSEEESFGLAALEALACGVPVIGTVDTGLVEVVEHETNGFLFRTGDTTSMAEAGISLLSDKERLEKFKESAYRLAIERFNADKIVTEYEDYYKEILNG
jgi:glycosyltransferase involved in cell wall biosynthesis